MAASDSHKLTVFITGLASLSVEQLAEQHRELLAEIEEIESVGEDATAEVGARNLLAVIDAIGTCRFPNTWETLRDSAGLNQEAA